MTNSCFQVPVIPLQNLSECTYTPQSNGFKFHYKVTQISDCDSHVYTTNEVSWILKDNMNSNCSTCVICTS